MLGLFLFAAVSFEGQFDRLQYASQSFELYIKIHV